MSVLAKAPVGLAAKDSGLLGLIDATMAVMNELILVMDEEIDLLKKAAIAEIQMLMRRKNKLIVQCQANMKSLDAQAEDVKKLAAAVRAKLKAVALKLMDVAKKNAEATKAAAQATQRLLVNIIGAVKKEKLAPLGYGNPRTARLDQGRYDKTCPPVAYNKTA